MSSSLQRHVWLLRYVPLLLWIGVIFFFSSGQGAATQTSRIIRPLLEFLFPAASFETIAFYHGIIRKFAHLFEYAVLGLLATRAFVRPTITYLPFIAAAVLVFVVAVLDETSQSSNPARTGSPYDVLIDLVGGLLAIGSSYLIYRRRKPA